MRAKEIGIEAYNREQVIKFDFLQTLLAEFNDGRRKTFYCVAVNLLPLPQIEKIMEQIGNGASAHSLPIKEKAATVVSLLEDAASKEGLVLKLRKKPTV